jgi:hypothetical protein
MHAWHLHARMQLEFIQPVEADKILDRCSAPASNRNFRSTAQLVTVSVRIGKFSKFRKMLSDPVTEYFMRLLIIWMRDKLFKVRTPFIYIQVVLTAHLGDVHADLACCCHV